MRSLVCLGIVLCTTQCLLAENCSPASSVVQAPEIENGSEGVVYSSLPAKRFDPYPYDYPSARDDLHKRFDLLDKRFDPYQKRFEVYKKRFDPYQKRSDPFSKRFDPYQKRFHPMDKRFDPLEKRFDPFQKRFDPYSKRFDPFMGSSGRRRVDFNPIDARAFFVTLG
ncbi:hypothetical protein PENTCL1PPCAC_30024 [Pristionchus entomophagus]|uniref:Uncharacterized protein n=1 Tax=Pristionchus entomophagus TaxID=358040 RepID=A0AAV5UL66_9BILA|nr:hypothetical protein PENTCL1PPCAC_30024 [Pristionchus entomophagus]